MEIPIGETSLWSVSSGGQSISSNKNVFEFYGGWQNGQQVHAVRTELAWGWDTGFQPTFHMETLSAEARLTLPRIIDAVAGEPTDIVYENLISDLTATDYRFEVDCDLGLGDSSRWWATPSSADIGDHVWTVKVFNGEEQVDSGTTLIRVLPSSAVDDGPINLLVVGDSLTYNSIYPNKLMARWDRSDGPKLTLLGTRHPSMADPQVFHEGYGGWTWYRFLTHYEPNPDPDNGVVGSPFVFLPLGQPTLDVARYYRESCQGRHPHFVTILLGLNDCISLDPADPATVEISIDQVLSSAEALVQGFRTASPLTDIGICLTLPPNARESAFTLNYNGLFTRQRWKPVQHRLVQKMLSQFDGREQSRVFIVPTGLSLSPLESYPPENATHPNNEGCDEIAVCIQNWMRARLHAHARQLPE